MSKMMRNYIIGLSIAILIYAVVVSWFVIRHIILPPEVIDTIILFILASATIFYALRTSDIADATRQQANASAKIAVEMREQRLTVSQPLVIPDFTEVTFPKPGIIRFSNLGNGPALRLEIKVAYSTPAIVERAWRERTGQYGFIGRCTQR